MKPQYLGDVIGSGRYFGHCISCHIQFMSTHDRVWVGNDGSRACSEACARKWSARHAGKPDWINPVTGNADPLRHLSKSELADLYDGRSDEYGDY